jgi:hypothetical protein
MQAAKPPWLASRSTQAVTAGRAIGAVGPLTHVGGTCRAFTRRPEDTMNSFGRSAIGGKRPPNSAFGRRNLSLPQPLLPSQGVLPLFSAKPRRIP